MTGHAAPCYLAYPTPNPPPPAKGLAILLRADDPMLPHGIAEPSWLEVRDLAAAVKVAMGFRDAHNLGSSNWTAGAICVDGTPYAYVSYNGRVWALRPDGNALAPAVELTAQ